MMILQCSAEQAAAAAAALHWRRATATVVHASPWLRASPKAVCVVYKAVYSCTRSSTRRFSRQLVELSVNVELFINYLCIQFTKFQIQD